MDNPDKAVFTVGGAERHHLAGVGKFRLPAYAAGR
jgi:hypothetical protein